MHVPVEKSLTVVAAAGLMLIVSLGLAGCSGGEAGLSRVEEAGHVQRSARHARVIYFTPRRRAAGPPRVRSIPMAAIGLAPLLRRTMAH